jgi:hypothetical protein
MPVLMMGAQHLLDLRLLGTVTLRGLNYTLYRIFISVRYVSMTIYKRCNPNNPLPSPCLLLLFILLFYFIF